MPIPDPLAQPVLPRRGWLPESDAILSIFLVLLLVTAVLDWPLRAAGAEAVMVVLRLLTVVAGVLAVAPNRLVAILAGIAALAVGYGQLVSGERSPMLLIARLVFFALAAVALGIRVFGPGRVTVHRLLGGVSVYVLLAILWGNAYQLVIVLAPEGIRSTHGAATLEDAMWLSIITITTCGYGDVLPVSPLARALAAIEVLVGVLFPAILISRLVSLLQAPAPRDGPGGG